MKKKNIEDFLLWRILGRLLKILLIFCSISIVITIVFSVLMRYIFKQSLFGVEEIILLLAMWLYFMGGVYSSYKDNHITADVLSNYLHSPFALRILRIIVTGICLAASIILAKWGITYIQWAKGVGGTTVGLHIPMLLSQAPLTICFIMMIIYNVYHFVNALIGRQVPMKGKAGEEA